MRSSNLRVSKAEVATMFAEADADGNGEIDLTEFLELMASKSDATATNWWAGWLRKRTRADLTPEQVLFYRDAFSTMDADGSGTLSAKEIHACLLDLDVRCSFADVRRMIKEADIDGNGEIDSDEFLEMMACNGASSGKKWQLWWRGWVPDAPVSGASEPAKAKGREPSVDPKSVLSREQIATYRAAFDAIDATAAAASTRVSCARRSRRRARS